MSELADFRASKDEFLATHPQSPIVDQANFSGLSYYAEDPDFRFEVPLAPVDDSTVSMGTSDGQERTYVRAGQVAMVVGGTEIHLTLLSQPGDDSYFLPFRDATSGKETYGAGRYLDIGPAIDGIVTVDFNLAYSPYCAYSDAFSCPLPPTENWLSRPITAGERDLTNPSIG